MYDRLLVTLTTEELKDIIYQCIEQHFSNVNHKPEMEKIMNRKEVSKILGVSLVTLNQWVKEGRIKQQKIKSRVYFKESEILNALNKSEIHYGKNK